MVLASRHFATGGADAKVNIWDLETQACVASVPRLQQPVHSLSFSADGRYLAAGTTDGVIDISHSVTGELVRTICLSRFQLQSLAFCPKHLVLACSGEESNKDGAVHLIAWPETSN